MCARSEGGTIKSSARRVLSKIDFLYLSTLQVPAADEKGQFDKFCAALKVPLELTNLPIVTRRDLPKLLAHIHKPGRLPQTVVNLPQRAVDLKHVVSANRLDLS
jgi:hypothetical protein